MPHHVPISFTISRVNMSSSLAMTECVQKLKSLQIKKDDKTNDLNKKSFHNIVASSKGPIALGRIHLPLNKTIMESWWMNSQ